MQGFCYTLSVSIVFSLIHLTCLKEGCQYLNGSVINRLTDQTFKDMHFLKITTEHNTKKCISTYKSGKQCSLFKKKMVVPDLQHPLACLMKKGLLAIYLCKCSLLKYLNIVSSFKHVHVQDS